MPDKNNLSSQDKSTLLVGVIATLVGLSIVLVSVDIIHSDPDSFHAPRWVVTLAGLTFACSGLLVLSNNLFSPSEQRDPILKWIQYFLTLGMLCAFASVFLWVGFGPGEREFSTSSSFLFFTVSGEGNATFGRIIFGGGGVLMALLTLFTAFRGAINIVTKSSDRDSPDE